MEGLADLLIAVPEDQRPVGPDEVHVLIAVLVPDERAGTTDEVGRYAAHGLVGADRAVHAAWDEALGLGKDLFALVESVGFRSHTSQSNGLRERQ